MSELSSLEFNFIEGNTLRILIYGCIDSVFSGTVYNTYKQGISTSHVSDKFTVKPQEQFCKEETTHSSQAT